MRKVTLRITEELILLAQVIIAPFVLDPNNNNLMYLCAGESIWRNDDLSAIQLTNQFDTISTNWVQFTDTLTITDEVITALAISKSPANILYYGTNKRNIYRTRT